MTSDRDRTDHDAATRKCGIALVVGATLLLAFMQLLSAASERINGRFAGLIPWDDNVILHEAIGRLTLLANTRSIHGAGEYWDLAAPHAPVADLQALIGIILFGSDFAGTYALNFLWVVVALVLVRRAFMHLPVVITAALFVAILIASLTPSVLMTIKADGKAVIFYGCAIGVLAERLLRSEVDRRRIAAVLLALTGLSKLTAFYVPVLLIATILLFELAVSIARAGATEGYRPAMLMRRCIGDLIADWRRIALVITIAVLPFALAMLWGANGSLIDYIREALSSTWTDGLSRRSRLAVYFPRPAYVALALLAIPVALIPSIRARRIAPALAVLCAFALAAIALVPLALAKTSNESFGCYFYGAMLGTALIAVRLLAEAAQRWPRAMAAPLALGLIGALLKFQLVAEPANLVARSGFEAMTRTMVALETRPSQVALLFEDLAAGHPNLALLHYRMTGRAIATRRIDTMVAPDNIAELRDIDFIVTLAPATNAQTVGFELSDRFATSRDLIAGDQAMRQDAMFERVACAPWRGGQLNLYRNRATTNPARPGQGAAAAC